METIIEIQTKCITKIVLGEQHRILVPGDKTTFKCRLGDVLKIEISEADVFKDERIDYKLKQGDLKL